MPEHRTYLEPYVGGGSVLLEKPKVEREIAGDLDDGLINLWQQIQLDQGFRCAINHPYTLDTFKEAEGWLSDQHPLTRAAGYIIRNRFSRGGLGKTFAWSDRLRGGKPGDANAWDTIRAQLPEIAERVKDVEFYCTDGLELIRRHDDSDTLTYLDPPYLLETRTSWDSYEYEFTEKRKGKGKEAKLQRIEEDRLRHMALLTVAQKYLGSMMISGYRSDLYDTMLKGWTRHEWSCANNAGQGKTKQKRVECVWTNF